MAEISGSKYTTQFYVEGIRSTPVDQKKAGDLTAADWNIATQNITQQITTGNTTMEDLDKLVGQYRYLYSAICEGDKVTTAMQENAKVFAQEFEKLFAKLDKPGGDSVEAYFFNVLGDLISARKSGNLSSFQNFAAAITEAAKDKARGSNQDRLLEMVLVLLAAFQLMQDTMIKMDSAAVTTQHAATVQEIKHDRESAAQKQEAQETAANAQIAGGSIQVAGGLASAGYAASAAGFKAEHAAQSAQQAALANNPAQAQQAHQAAANADAAMAGLKLATAKSESASAVGQGTNTVSAASGQNLSSSLTQLSDEESAKGKEKSLEASIAGETSKVTSRGTEGLVQASKEILSSAGEAIQSEGQSQKDVLKA